MIASAISGMIDSINDPYTTYLDEADSNNFNVSLEGSFQGIGVEVTNDSDNTIIVYTTDHSTYTDNHFYKAFPNYDRPAEFLDEIPLFIYQKDIKPDVIDVNGKNTLGLAPTILDYLDISADNYFLGNSLFSSISRNNYDYYYFYPGVCYSTFDSSIQGVADDDEIINKIVKYISTAKN